MVGDGTSGRRRRQKCSPSGTGNLQPSETDTGPRSRRKDPTSSSLGISVEGHFTGLTHRQQSKCLRSFKGNVRAVSKVFLQRKGFTVQNRRVPSGEGSGCSS